MPSTEKCQVQNFYIHIGAPDPINIRYRSGGETGTLISFDSTLKFTFVNASGTITLGVGSGITLSADEGVPNARASIQLTVLQSRAIPEGALTRYEIQRTSSGREEVFLMGALIGEGGGNPDA